MSDELNWGYEMHDFSAIEATLKKFHPIENSYQYNSENIEAFRGYKDIQEIIHDNFLTTKSYKERWVLFKKFLEKALKKPVEELMTISYPCYSGSVTLEKETHKNISHTKELHFFISLLGPYYSILGFDKCSIRLKQNTLPFEIEKAHMERVFHEDLAVTVSPYLEFEEPFIQMQKKILEYFPDLKFIPFKINQIKINGSTLLFREDVPLFKHSVFSALFQPENLFHSDFLESAKKIRGDIFFGLDEWAKIKKPNKSRLEEIRNILLKNSLNNKSVKTFHKVWMLKYATKLPNKYNGMLMLLSPPVVMDLTDENTATIISQENEEPTISKYSIIDHEIVIDTFQFTAGLRIKLLEKKQLILILFVNYHDGEKTLRADILELTYVEYR